MITPVVDAVETIVAIATPPGRGALGIIRVSGPRVKGIATILTGTTLSPRIATLCRFRDEQARVIDEGLALYFPMPHSYTGEDVLEIHAHGNRVVLDLIVKRVTGLGARPARPGEFTERAFHNNKLDLVQAEAVAALIDAASVQAARSAARSLEGAFSKCVNILLRDLIGLRVFVESALDFSEEEIDTLAAKDIQEKLSACRTDLEAIRSRAKQGAILKEGATAVIIGGPNVGKSTLLNQLAGREAAIVTEIPGTTRDLIPQDIVLDGIPIRVIDTAGIRNTQNVIEREGIRRALDAMEQTDIVILVREYNRSVDEDEKKLIDDIKKGKYLIILNNKIDLCSAKPGLEYADDTCVKLAISAKTGQGIDLFVSRLKQMLGVREMQEDIFMARRRHLEALDRADQALDDATGRAKRNDGLELLAEDLRLAQQALGEITGEFAPDDLLGEIFATFCIGK